MAEKESCYDESDVEYPTCLYCKKARAPIKNINDPPEPCKSCAKFKKSVFARKDNRGQMVRLDEMRKHAGNR